MGHGTDEHGRTDYAFQIERFQTQRLSLTPALSQRRGGIIRRRLAATSDRTGSWSQCMRKNRKGAPHEPDRMFLFEKLSLTPALSRPSSAAAILRKPLKVRAGRGLSKATQCPMLRRTGWEREIVVRVLTILRRAGPYDCSASGSATCRQLERTDVRCYAKKIHESDMRFGNC